MTAHQRLRQARDAKGWTIHTLGQRTGVREQVLEAIDEGEFGELPAGVYGRHAVRAYAAAVGLDADAVMAEVSPLLRTLEDPIDALARVRGISRRSPPPAEPRRGSRPAPPRSVAATPETPSATGTSDWRPLAASMIDSGLLAVFAIVLVYLTALAAGTPVREVLAIAAPALLGLVALTAAIYFVILGGVCNATVGARLLQIEWLPRERRRIDGRATLRRGLQCALREGSVLVEVLVSIEQTRHWIRALRARRV